MIATIEQPKIAPANIPMPIPYQGFIVTATAILDIKIITAIEKLMIEGR